MNLTQWVQENGLPLATLDPAAPLDDLEPLRGIIGSARVVGIGESAHHVREFYLLRHRLLRFLVERCGFNAYAFEAPYVGSRPINSWVHGGGDDLAELCRAPAMFLSACEEMFQTLIWLREHNTAAERPVQFLGTVAGDGAGSPLPELLSAAENLRTTDPDALNLLDRAIAAARTFHDLDPFRALDNYGRLDEAARDALTADLSRLLARAESMAATIGAAGEGARTDLRAAWLVDHLHRDLNGRGLPIGTTALDAFMAESVQRHVDADPEAKVLLALHNVHLRTGEVQHRGPRGLFPAGHRLRSALGQDFVTILATGDVSPSAAPAREQGGGDPAILTAAPTRPEGTESASNDVTAPTLADLRAARPAILTAAPTRPDSIESAFDGVTAPTLADLRAARPVVQDGASYRTFRSEGTFGSAAVLDELDAVAYIPDLTPSTRR